MSEPPLRRVLMLAYFFPPLGGGGVQRTLKHVKYLPEHGFDPIVVTTKLGWSPMLDATLAQDVRPGTTLIRARELPLQIVKWVLGGALRRARLPARLTSYVGWPDEMAGWIPGATWHTLRAIRRYRPEVLYSTHSPASAHLAALVAHRVTGIPWVADFRDAWTRNPQGDRVARPFARLSARAERAIVRHAAFVVVVDESVELLDIDLDDPRMVVIRNGVDPDDVPQLDAAVANERFRISYVGTLYGERDAAPVFAALRALVDRGAIEEASLDLRIVGPTALDADANLERLRATRTGYVDHATAVSEMAAADVLLFYAPAINRGPSGKVYEYLASGRPILCVAGRDNFAFKLVRELGAGECVEPDDRAGIEEAIARLYGSWKRGTLAVGEGVRAEALRRFSRPTLAGALAAVLDAAATGRERPRDAEAPVARLPRDAPRPAP